MEKADAIELTAREINQLMNYPSEAWPLQLAYAEALHHRFERISKPEVECICPKCGIRHGISSTDGAAERPF